MKKTFIGLVILGSISTNAFSAQLFCKSDGMTQIVEGNQSKVEYDTGIKPINQQLLLVEKIVGECKSIKMKDGEPYIARVLKFELIGYGPGLHMSNAYFSITCPTAKERNLTKNGFYGIKAGIALGLGADAAVFSNKRLGLCVIGGIKTGIGAGLSGAKIKFIE